MAPGKDDGSSSNYIFVTVKNPGLEGWNGSTTLVYIREK